jgi:hypothetical protein
MAISISKPELVTLALGVLGGADRPFDTEDVALKAHELAATAFAWRNYPERINLELVRVALVDATRPKTGSFVQGRGRGGWVLTDRGVSWFSKHGESLLAALHQPAGASKAKVKQPETQHRERERIRLTRSDAWRKWTTGGLVSPVEASSVFRIDLYTLSNARLTKTRGLRQLFEGDPELDPFLAAMATLLQQASADEDMQQ